MQYHYLNYSEDMDLYFGIFLGRWILDVMLMVSIPGAFIIGFIPNIIFILTNILIWSFSGVESARYLKLYCVDLSMGLLDYTSWKRTRPV